MENDEPLHFVQILHIGNTWLLHYNLEVLCDGSHRLDARGQMDVSMKNDYPLDFAEILQSDSTLSPHHTPLKDFVMHPIDYPLKKQKQISLLAYIQEYIRENHGPFSFGQIWHIGSI